MNWKDILFWGQVASMFVAGWYILGFGEPIIKDLSLRCLWVLTVLLGLFYFLEKYYWKKK